VLANARRGRFRLEFDIRRLEAFGHQLDRSANRITMGLITSALIVGTAIALTVPGGPEILGLPLFATLGFACSVVVGLGLLWSIWRAGKH
jgi:ubiquinone biosynthesis protein